MKERVMKELEKKCFTAELYGHGWNGQTVGNLLRLEDVVRVIIEFTKNDENDWIPVKKKYPKSGTEVLCSFDDGSVETLWQNWGEDESGLIYFELGDEEKDGGTKKAIAWKPLPEPYVGERDF